MLVIYRFEIYYRKDKKNFVDLLSRKSNYAVDNKREKENSLKTFILKRVRFKILIINLSWEKESLNLRLLIRIIIETIIYSKKS